MILLSVSNFYSQNNSFWFPEDLPIDPLDYSLEHLEVKEIEIFRIVLKDDTSETENRNISVIYMDYLIKYDSVNQLRSINYNFRRLQDYELLPDGKTVWITPKTDSKFLHTLKYANDTIPFSSWINIYRYEGSGLKNVEIERSVRIEDGVFIVKRIPENIKYEHTTEGELLKQKKIFHDEKLYATIEYEYITLNKNDRQFQLLTKIKTRCEDDRNTTEQIIKYSL